MFTFSGCADVSNSGFVDYQESLPDFAAFLKGALAPDAFIQAEKKEDLPLIMFAEYPCAGVRRCMANVQCVHAFVLDIDEGTMEQILPALEKAQQYGHFVYTSYRHDLEKQPKFRVVVKVSRPVSVLEWPKFWPRATHFFGLLNKVPGLAKADPKCADACHMFYAPGAADQNKFESFGADGPGLDVDKILALPLPTGATEAEPTTPLVLPEDERGEITQELRDYWKAKLENNVDALLKLPIPSAGTAYGLKCHAMFGIARGIPHIISEDLVRKKTRAALASRSAKYGGSEAQLEKDYGVVNAAIEDGKGQPWYPPAIDTMYAHPLTEVGLAERLIDRHGIDLLWEPAQKRWYVWNSKRWNNEAGNELVTQRLIDTARSIEDEIKVFDAECWLSRENFEALEKAGANPSSLNAAKRKLEDLEEQMGKLKDFAQSCEVRKVARAGIDFASSFPQVLGHHHEFDSDPYGMNFHNGIVDLRTGTLRAHDRNDRYTKMVPFDYKPGAHPLTDRFLDDLMCGNHRMVKFLKRLIGYTALGLTTEQMLIMCIGEGANGKSTLMNLLLRMFGEGAGGYSFAAQSENLLTSHGASQHSTWRMSLAARRLVACLEVEEGKSFAESLVKMLTGGDTITGRKLYQDESSFKPVHQLWLCANHLPHVRGTDIGIWRRLNVLPFLANFRGHEDKDILQKLTAEIPAFWGTIVKEAGLYLIEGIHKPREVIVATERYRREQDPLRSFLEHYCVMEPNAFIRQDLLWAAYMEFSETNKPQIFHEKKRFYAAMEKRVKRHKRVGVFGFKGLRLKTAKERQEALPSAQLRAAEEEAKKRAEAEASEPN